MRRRKGKGETVSSAVAIRQPTPLHSRSPHTYFTQHLLDRLSNSTCWIPPSLSAPHARLDPHLRHAYEGKGEGGKERGMTVRLGLPRREDQEAAFVIESERDGGVR